MNICLRLLILKDGELSEYWRQEMTLDEQCRSCVKPEPSWTIPGIHITIVT